MGSVVVQPLVRAILTEPSVVPDCFVTGMEIPLIHPEFARLVFWTDYPPQVDITEPIVERQVAAKLVMPMNTFRMVRRLMVRSLHEES